MRADRRPFGHLENGRQIDRIDLAAGDVAAAVLTYGATLASLQAPDAHGEVADVVLGFDALDGWLDDPQYFGSTVGRFSNRIRHGRLHLDGVDIQVTANDGPHHLHGGAVGFDKVVWEAEPFMGDGAVGVVLSHSSPDRDEGFPGALDVSVSYTLDDAGGLTIAFTAECDRPTVVNLTNHAYLNLAGGGTIDDHEVAIAASRYLPVDDATLPTGEIATVAGTPFDLRTPHRLGALLGETREQLRLAGGYDHCFVVDGEPGVLRPCAVVRAAGRRLEVATTQPGVQVYSGQHIRPRRGRGGQRYGPRSGLCLETQHFPDAPNHPGFPPTVLRPGDRLTETTRLSLRSEEV